MLILISGSNSSGKSVYAEQMTSRLAGPRYYIATMVSQGEENERRIEKHRRQRAGLGFTTIEEPWQVGSAPVTEDSVVLLEDVTNLLGNVIFSANGTPEDALEQIRTLSKRCRHLVMVAISGLDESAYTGETADYIRSAHWLNEQLFNMADQVIELENGTPTRRK